MYTNPALAAQMSDTVLQQLEFCVKPYVMAVLNEYQTSLCIHVFIGYIFLCKRSIANARRGVMRASMSGLRQRGVA